MFKVFLLVDSDAERNTKFTMLEENGAITCTIERVGATPIKRRYPMTSWDRLCKKKKEEGYRDVSDFYTDAEHKKFKDEPDPLVAKFLRDFEKAQRTTFSNNYDVDFSAITAAMVEEVQDLLYRAGKSNDVKEVNELLVWHRLKEIIWSLK